MAFWSSSGTWSGRQLGQMGVVSCHCMFVPMGRDGVTHFRLYSSYTRKWAVRTSSPRTPCPSETGLVPTRLKAGALAMPVLLSSPFSLGWREWVSPRVSRTPPVCGPVLKVGMATQAISPVQLQAASAVSVQWSSQMATRSTYHATRSPASFT
jgi:hypothetical protein